MATQDPVTDYARKVTAGDVVASRLVRQACQRHLDDLARQADTGLEWRPQRALEAIQFFPDVLCLPDRSGGDVTPETGEPKPFVLEPWQQFIVGACSAGSHRRASVGSVRPTSRRRRARQDATRAPG